jgi:hypothetical protein
MKTITFYGDSFCASDTQDSWCVILAELLNCKIKRFGVGGSSIWTSFLNFEKDQKTNDLADYMIFCWTDETRLYHPTLPLTPNNKPILGTDINIWQSAQNYYKYLSFKEKDTIAYRYALQFFDQNVLKKYDKDRVIVHMWSMMPQQINLDSGIFINESCLIHSWDGNVNYQGTPDLNLINHMTKTQNKTWAEKIYENINSRM